MKKKRSKNKTKIKKINPEKVIEGKTKIFNEVNKNDNAGVNLSLN